MLTTSEDRLNAASLAYVNGSFERAKELLDNLIDEPSYPYSIGARYLRARGLEDGVFSGTPDLNAALLDFSIVREHMNDYGSDGALGCARVLYLLDGHGNRDQIILLCNEAIDRDRNVKAMMILGKAYEELIDDKATSRMWYLRAFRRGLPWGMQFYARSHYGEGNLVRAAVGYMAAAVARPFLILKYGNRSPFK
ncbi:MAG: hypothetical protein J0L89_09755 [Xanthomonadales bacterium]|nr:hypothetical protein [Xanthomonadales bacterium]